MLYRLLIPMFSFSLLFSITDLLQAANLQSPFAFGSAAMNSTGDFVLHGNEKAVLRVSGKFFGKKWERKRPDSHPTYSSMNAKGEAVLCGSRSLTLFSGGEFFDVDLADPKLRIRTCFIDDSGHWLAVGEEGFGYGVGRELIKWKVQKNIGTRNIWKWKDRWVLLVDSGSILVWEEEASRFVKTAAKISYLDPLDNSAVKDGRILIAGSFDAAEYQMEGRAEDPATWTLNRTSIPVRPCGDSQRCGLSLADDGSWMIVGAWGGYHGFGARFTRIEVYSLPDDQGGPGIAHSGKLGEFALLSTVESDFGSLQDVVVSQVDFEQADSAKNGNEPDSEGYVVWSREPLTKKSVKVSLGGKSNKEVYLSIGANKPKVGFLAYEKAIPFQMELPVQSQAASTDKDYWWVEDIGADTLFDQITVDPAAVKLAVVDTGRSTTHPFFEHVDFFDGEFDFVHENLLPEDENGHGSHVTGLALGKDGDRYLGVGQNAQLIALKAFDRKGQSNSVDITRALVAALEQGVEIVNCSWGGGPRSLALADAFAALVKTGTILVTSAGNDGLDVSQSQPVPISYPGVWSVGAYNKNGQKSKFSNYSALKVHFMTAGEDLGSAGKGEDLETYSGSSMSAGVMSGGVSYLLGLAKKLKKQSTNEAIDFSSIEVRLGLKQKVFEALCPMSHTPSTAVKIAMKKVSICGRLDIKAAAKMLVEPVD